MNTQNLVIAVAVALLAWAMMPINPYGYYMFLRVVICGVLAYLAWRALDGKESGWVFLFGFGAILYNPIATVSLTRGLWTVINLLTIGALVAFSLKSRALRSSKR